MLSAEYLAGLFDGEGHVEITNKGSLRIGIANTYLPILEMLRTQLGGGIHKVSGKAHWKQGYIWRPCGPRARRFLVHVLPYLTIKHDRALVALQLETNPHGKRLTEEQQLRRVVLRQLLADLNKRGL